MTKPLRIALADPPGLAGEPLSLQTPTLGILYLISSIKQKFDDVEIIYIDGAHSKSEHLDRIREFKPDIYGISFTTMWTGEAYGTMIAVKSMLKEILIICGGAHTTAAPKEVFEQSVVDICCIGEGEHTILDIISDHLAEGNFSSVAGIAFRKPDGTVKFNPPRPLIDSLDSIPFPSWDLIDHSRFSGISRRKASPSTCIITSRGCPFDCTFCSNPVWKQQKPWVRKRSPENIVKEIQLLYKSGIREIFIFSDEMNPDIKWCTAVFEAIAKLGYRDLYFQCQLRAKPIDARLTKALSDANCWLVNLGIESGSQRVLDGIRKNIAIADIKNACQEIKKHNIKVFAFMMMYQVWEENGKLEIEHTRDVIKSLTMVWKLKSKGLIDYMSWSYAMPIVGSHLYRIAYKYDLVERTDIHSSQINRHEIHMTLPGVSRRAMIAMRSLGLLMEGWAKVTSGDYFKKGQFIQSSRIAIKKMGYVIRPW